MAELVDARDLKSLGALPRAGSRPAPGTNFGTCPPQPPEICLTVKELQSPREPVEELHGLLQQIGQNADFLPLRRCH